MAKHYQTTEDKRKQQSRPKPVTTELLHNQADPAGLIGLSEELISTVGDGTTKTQVARLGDVRLQTVQRQVLAAQIGRVQGNRHLQRVVALLERDEQYEQETDQATEQVMHMPKPDIQLKPV